MNIFVLTLSFFALILSPSFSYHPSKISLPFKHLAGPPSSFHLHRPPLPNLAKVVESSNFIHIHKKNNKSHSLEIPLHVDSPSLFRFVILFNDSSSKVRLLLRDPHGTPINTTSIATPSRFPLAFSSTGTYSVPTYVYSLTGTPPHYRHIHPTPIHTPPSLSHPTANQHHHIQPQPHTCSQRLWRPRCQARLQCLHPDSVHNVEPHLPHTPVPRHRHRHRPTPAAGRHAYDPLS